MGGDSSFLACENNTIPTVMVTLAAAVTNPSSVTAAANISIPTLVISGSEDCVAKPSDHQIPMYNALASSCKIYISIKDGGHCYFANYNFNCTFGEETCDPGGPPLSRENQQAATMNFVKPYFDFFLKGNVSSWNSFVDSLNTSTRITFIKDCNINPSALSNDYTNPGVVTFPNPVSQLLYYQTSALPGKANIQIFNTTQMKVYDSEIFIRNEAQT